MKVGTAALRRIALLVALTATLAASLWTYWGEQRESQEDVVQAAHQAQSKPAQVNHENHVPVSSLSAVVIGSAEFPQRDVTKVNSDPFLPLAITPVAAPAPIIVPAIVVPPPTAPTLPFQYAGKLEQSQKTVVYLNRGSDSYSVLPGDNIDANYRFVGIEGDNLVFMYLPLSQRQTLPFGP